MSLDTSTPKLRGRYSPINPVALSTDFAAPNKQAHDSGIARSGVAGDNSELLENVAKLWICPGDVVVDATFGRGVFWKNLLGLPTHAHDLKTDGVDCRKLPYADASVDVEVIDPPYRPTHGSKTFTQDNGLAAAYGLGRQPLDTINDVLALYEGALKEASRVVKVGGALPCQVPRPVLRPPPSPRLSGRSAPHGRGGLRFCGSIHPSQQNPVVQRAMGKSRARQKVALGALGGGSSSQ